VHARLRIGAFPTALAGLVPAAIDRLRLEHPETRVIVDEGTAELPGRVRAGELHLALAFQDTALPRAEPPGLERRDLFRERFLVALAPHHPLAERPAISLGDLRADDWTAALTDGLIARACRAAGFEPNLVSITHDQLAIRALVLRGLAVTLVTLEKEPTQVSSADPGAGGASNSWVVSGARRRQRQAGDGQRPAPRADRTEHLVLRPSACAGMDAIGATLPGVPGVIIGRNDRIAWGATNTGPDVQDLYLEKLDDKGGYVAPEGPRPFTVVRELIKVKDAPDTELNVRISRHGPVISDVLARALDATPRGHALALAWTALAEDDVSLGAFLKLPRARNWREFVDATRGLSVPQQNLTYADVDGNIGFIAPAKIPIRKPGNDLHGLAPAPGWDARYDWAGFIPFDELPRSFNPPAAKIVTANHKIVPPGYRHHITYEWDLPFRAQRIDQLLEDVKQHDRASFSRMQADVVSLAARQLLPRLVAIQGRSIEAAEVLKWLAAWTARCRRRRPSR